MNQAAAYPFSDKPGLCVVLRDPRLWADVFDYAPARKSLKMAAKKALRLTVLRVNDEFVLGKKCVELLSMPSGRAALAKARGTFASVGLLLLCELYYRHGQIFSGAKEFALFEDDNPKLEFDQFAQWLRSREWAAHEITPLAQFLCGLAMRWPELAGQLLALGTDHEPRVQNLLFDEEKLVKETTERDSSEASSDNGREELAVEIESGAPAAATGDEIKESSAAPTPAPVLAKGETRHGAELPLRQTVAQWRNSLAALRRRLAKEEACVAQLDQTAEVVERAALEVARLPCLLEPLQLGNVAKIIDEADGNAELERLTETGLLLGQVLRRHSQLEVLMQRLRLPTERWLPGGRADLQILAAQIEERSEALNQQVELLNRTIALGMEFIDQIATADVSTAVALVSEAVPELWLSLARLLFDTACETEATSARRAALGTPEIAGLILAQTWHREDAAAVSLADGLLASAVGNWSLRDFAALLSPLGLEQMQTLAKRKPEWAHVVTSLVFIHAMHRDRVEFFDYFDPLLYTKTFDHACRDFFRAISSARHYGGFSSVVFEMRRALTGEPTAEDSGDAIESARQRVLKLATESPGMEGTYRRLRIFAQRLYLEPLIEAIQRANVREVVSQWKAFGDLADMAETAIRSSGERKVDKPHHEQTRRYLEHFADELQRWERMSAAASQPRGAGIVGPAVRALRNATSHAARALLDALESPELETFPPQDFGERGGTGGIQRVSDQTNGAYIGPTMLASWPLAPTGEVPLAALVADSLREHAVEGGIPLQHAIKAYVQSGHYDAARRAALGNPPLQEFIENELAQRREALKREHEQLWDEAKTARGFDQDVDDCMGEIELMLGNNDFVKAAGLYDLLSDLLIDCRRKSDPERQAFSAFLAEGGVEFPPLATRAELETQVQYLRESNSGKRHHLTALRDSAVNELAPEPLRNAWLAAAQRLDRPSFWPLPGRSAALAGALAKLFPWIRGKWQYRSGDLDPITAIVQRVIEWVPSQMLLDLQTAEAVTPSAVVQLADLVAEYCPDAAVLRHIGETPAPPQPAISATSVSLTRAHAPAPDTAASTAPLVVEPVSPPQKAGALIREYMEIEDREDGADFTKLREAGRTGDWARVRRLAATLACSDRGQEDSVRQDLQALYGIGYLQTETGFNDALLQDACVAVIASRRADYYAGAAITSELPARAIIHGLHGTNFSGALVEQLGQSLSAVAEAQATADNFQWFAELLRKTTNAVIPTDRGTGVTAKLGRYLWEQFKNLARSEDYRSRLLRVLFRNHQPEALRDLAELSPLKDLIHTCLRAFDAAESDPDASAAALQLSAALRGQAQRKPNTQPWILLFHSLESARAAGDHAALHYELDSDFVNEEADGRLSVELRIKPSLFDPPQRLSVTIGNLSPLVVVEEAFFTEKSVSVPIPASLVPSVGVEYQVSYRIEGMTTTQRRPIDLRGTWRLHRGQTTIPLDELSVSHAWPGATRNPVKRNWGFFGREEEIRRIENHIHAPARIGSVMVFGERRIGKTSVLKEIISTMPPERGRVCGAFCDLSGLQFSGNPGSIPDAFFQRLVTYLDLPTENGSIAHVLAQHRGHPVKIERLARNLTPSISLYGALETLVQNLDEESGGVISRIAFFIDEFDRFVEPLVRARRDEVNNFMWELRQVIQRSERISLILAGSGLQRLLKENYQDALFGSIDEVTLPRFSWEKDCDAITDTFMPKMVRAQLCRAEEVPRLAQYAAEICGGHPMFLALLGSSAAQMARGRFLTPGFLDRVVASIVQAEPGRSRLNVERKFFYQFVFESLGILDPREYALARGLFATLARVTTWEKTFAWFPVSRVIEVSGLLQYSSNRQLLSALDRLGKSDAILNDKAAGQVRISVPITAAAVREDEGAIRAEVEHVLQTLEK